VRRAVDDVIDAVRRASAEAVNLLVGEPCFAPPAEIRGAFERLAGVSASGYGPPGGEPALRAVLADREGRGRLQAEQVMISHGAKGGLLMVLAELIEPGDEVVHPLPCYPAYPAMVRRFGGTPIGVAEHGDGFAGWSDGVLAAVSPRTKAVILSSPSNPSGTTVAEGELAALVDGCRERGIRLVLDEAYSAFRFAGTRVDPAEADPDHRTLIRVGSASKSFALCGWRIGWIIADRELVDAVIGVQSALLNPPATPPQRALVALPEVPESYFEHNRSAVRERLLAMTEAVRRAGFDAAMPAGGFYLWVDVRDRLDAAAPTSAAWCRKLAEARGVGLWPGEDYGTPGWVRFALPHGETWRETVAELERRFSR